MANSRVCSYFEHTCVHASSTPTTLMSLPENVRDRIYREAGAITKAKIRIVEHFSLSKVTGDTPHDPYDYYCHWGWYKTLFVLRSQHRWPLYFIIFSEDIDYHFELSLGLSTSCRAINHDLARFLCRHNEITICLDKYHEIPVLFRLPQYLLQAIGHMSIHLNQVNHRLHECSELCMYSICFHGEIMNGSPYCIEPIRSSSEEFPYLLKMWDLFTDRLANLTDTKGLKLRVFCEVEDVKTALMVREPLAKLVLRSCTIRLAHGLIPIFERIAMGAIRCTIKDDRTFPFFDLPCELRQYILSFTDLVTPFKYIGRNFRDGCCFETSKGCLVPQPGNGTWVGSDVDLEPRLMCKEEMFCSVEDTVYPPCKCWHPPTGLFLVCKTMYRDAMETLQRYNICRAEIRDFFEAHSERFGVDINHREVALI